MGKIMCVCKHIISTVDFPHPHAFLMTTEQQLDDIESKEEFDSVSSVIDDINTVAIYGLRCPHCSRLLLFESGRDQGITYYQRETS